MKLYVIIRIRQQGWRSLKEKLHRRSKKRTADITLKWKPSRITGKFERNT